MTLVLNFFYRLLETLSESLGVLREVWFTEGTNTQNDPVLKYHPIFREAANTLSILDAFDIAPDYSTPYVQRLSSFIQVWKTYAGPKKENRKRFLSPKGAHMPSLYNTIIVEILGPLGNIVGETAKCLGGKNAQELMSS